MKRYQVFRHPSGATEAVKQGWSWPAFFFCVIWAFVKKLWGVGSSLLGSFIVLAIVAGDGAAADALFNVVVVVVAIVLGLNGNAMRIKNLTARGFELVDTVTAANADGALALYLKGSLSPSR